MHLLYCINSSHSRTFDANNWTQIFNLYNQISAKKTRRKIVSAHVLWIALNHSSSSLCDLLNSLNAEKERKYFYLEDIGDNFRKFDRSILIQVWERAAHPFLLDQFHRNTEYSLFTAVSWLPFEFSMQNLSSFLSYIVQFFPKFAETLAQFEDLCSFMLKVLESEIKFLQDQTIWIPIHHFALSDDSKLSKTRWNGERSDQKAFVAALAKNLQYLFWIRSL